jgi:hypothetical protein
MRRTNARNGLQAVPPDEWSRRFGALLTRREGAARAGGWEQDEVDREVTGDAGLLDDADLRKWL